MIRRSSRSALDVWLICLAVFACTWAVAARHYRVRMLDLARYGMEERRETQPLSARYGPGRYSEHFEEWIVRDHFGDRRGGVFLDVGANHYMAASNTYYLESSLGWSGVAVDALEEFEADYRHHRPRTQFVTAFVSDKTDDAVSFFVPDENKLVASVSEEFTRERGTPGTAREVPTTTLNVILEKAGIRRLDFVSMDIELSEPKALAGFDLERYKPSLVCVEAHPEVRQQIIDYFVQRGYTIVAKYLRADATNLYFTPMVAGSGEAGV
jgi:FkbM family methyltransferase